DRTKRGLQAREGVEEHYVWDKTAKTWSDHFDTLNLTGKQGKWDSPPEYMSIKCDLNNPPPNLSNEDFVLWAISNTVGESYLYSLMALDMTRCLNYGIVLG